MSFTKLIMNFVRIFVVCCKVERLSNEILNLILYESKVFNILLFTIYLRVCIYCIIIVYIMYIFFSLTLAEVMYVIQ